MYVTYQDLIQIGILIVALATQSTERTIHSSNDCL